MEKTTQLVRQQIEAMGADVFEVGLFKPSAAVEGRAVMIPRTWDAATLIRSIPWLRLQNADGRNVYVRPKGEHNLSLVDDLNADGVKRMKETGFAPAVVVETSPGNFQVWLKHSRQLPRELSTLAARGLAKEFDGDRGAADWRHFGRLCAYTNRKPRYAGENGLFPFVRLIEASGKPYPEAETFIARITRQREVEQQDGRELRNTRIAGSGSRVPRSIDEFRANPRYGGDATRVDLAYAIYALSHGANEVEVAAALRSRDLSHKGDEKRQDQYVERTVGKALKVAECRCR